MDKILLIFPPFWDMFSPYSSVPTLAAFLRMKGVKVDVWDANIEIYDCLISDSYLEECLKDLEKRVGQLDKNSPQFETTVKRLELGRLILGQVDRCKSELKSPHADRETMLRGKNMIENLRAIATAKVETRPEPRSPKEIHTLRDLRQVVEDNASYNSLYPLIYSAIETRLKEFSGNVVGISVAGIPQLANAFLTARIIKTLRHDMTIVMGGPIFQYIQKILISREKLLDLDFLVTGEGETPLYRLLQELESSKNWASIPNLIYLDSSGKYIRSEQNSMENMDELPIPDYADIPLDKYLAFRMISYLTARGCYWNHCNFCSLACNYGHQYHTRDLDKVISDLQYLKKRHNLEYIFFNDEAIPPKRLLDISEKMLKADLHLKSFVNLRMEDGLTRHHLEQAYKAGFRIAFFGTESGSQATLDMMRKGTKVESMSRILKESHESGLANHIAILTAFPGDCNIDETISFLQTNAEYIDSMICGYFSLENTSYVFQHPDEFDITISPTPPDYFGTPYAYQENGKQKSPFRDYKYLLDRCKLYHFHPSEFFGYDDRHFLIHISEFGKMGFRRQNQENIQKRQKAFDLLVCGKDFYVKTNPDVQILPVSPGFLIAYKQSIAHVVFNEVVCCLLQRCKERTLFSVALKYLSDIFGIQEENIRNDLSNAFPMLALDFLTIEELPASAVTN